MYGPQLLGTVACGSAARTHGGPIMAEDTTRNGIGMVGLVADNAMVIEAAATAVVLGPKTLVDLRHWLPDAGTASKLAHLCQSKGLVDLSPFFVRWSHQAC